jgi:DNA-binding phage protein
MTKPNTISEQLRQVILASEKSRYRIWKETGVSQASLCKFISGTTGLTLENIDAIGQCLGLELVAKAKRKRG